VIDAAWWADHIVIGPGDLFTSIIAGLIVPGVKEAFQKSRAKVLYVLNIMTKFGETHNFSGWDFVACLEGFMGREVDGVLCNTASPEGAVLAKYGAQKAEPVQIDPGNPCWGRRRLYAADLLDTSGGIVRHDSKKLAQQLRRIIDDGAADRGIERGERR
jgi:uncharacterized cofD-like protein